MHSPTDHLSKDGFRLRGTHMSRVDGFSDIVFGFAVTLLVVSLEVPKDYSELHRLMLGFVPFGISFLLLMLVWYAHYRFFRRYGTEDAGTLWLNGMLLFFVLFYTYPLKFLFASMFRVDPGPVFSHPSDSREITLLYAGGFTLIYGLVTALYWNGWRQRRDLQLDALECRLTKLYIYDEGAVALIGLTTCAVALLLPAGQSSLATMLFMLIGVTKTWFGRKIGQTRHSYPPRASDAVLLH